MGAYGFAALAFDVMVVAAGESWAEYLSNLFGENADPGSNSLIGMFCGSYLSSAWSMVVNTDGAGDVDAEEWKDYWREHMPSIYRLFRHVFMIQNQPFLVYYSLDLSLEASERPTILRLNLQSNWKVSLWYVVFAMDEIGAALKEECSNILTHQSNRTDVEASKDVTATTTERSESKEEEKKEPPPPSCSDFVTACRNAITLILFIAWLVSYVPVYLAVAIFQFFIGPFFWVSIPLSDDGLKYLFAMISKIISFLVISLGFWNDHAVNCFKLGEKFERFSLAADAHGMSAGMDPRNMFATMLTSIVGPRALLFLLFPELSGKQQQFYLQ